MAIFSIADRADSINYRWIVTPYKGVLQCHNVALYSENIFKLNIILCISLN